MGMTDLIFVDPGAKVNGSYYRETLLLRQMLPAIKRVAGDTFVFQQHTAPAHRARETIELLQRETPGFISPDLWPPTALTSIQSITSSGGHATAGLSDDVQECG